MSAANDDLAIWRSDALSPQCPPAGTATMKRCYCRRFNPLSQTSRPEAYCCPGPLPTLTSFALARSPHTLRFVLVRCVHRQRPSLITAAINNLVNPNHPSPAQRSRKTRNNTAMSCENSAHTKRDPGSPDGLSSVPGATGGLCNLTARSCLSSVTSLARSITSQVSIF